MENSESYISSPSFNQMERCSVHKKKLEIVCLLDKARICSSCALFGEHRTHQVLPVEEVVLRVQSKINELFISCSEVDSL